MAFFKAPERRAERAFCAAGGSLRGIMTCTRTYSLFTMLFTKYTYAFGSVMRTLLLPMCPTAGPMARGARGDIPGR